MGMSDWGERGMKDVHFTSDLFSLHHDAIILAEMCNDAGEHAEARYWLRKAANYRAALARASAKDRATALRQIGYPIRFPAAPGYRPARAVSAMEDAA